MHAGSESLRFQFSVLHDATAHTMNRASTHSNHLSVEIGLKLGMLLPQNNEGETICMERPLEHFLHMNAYIVLSGFCCGISKSCR